MASFETDLSRYLARQEREQAADEAARAEFGDDYSTTFHVAGESATLIPASDVLDAEVPGPVRRYGSDDPGRVVPGCWD